MFTGIWLNRSSGASDPPPIRSLSLGDSGEGQAVAGGVEQVSHDLIDRHDALLRQKQKTPHRKCQSGKKKGDTKLTVHCGVKEKCHNLSPS